MAKKKQKVIVLPNGKELPILKDNGKFYVCEDRQFRKSNPDLVIKTKEPEETPVEETKGGDE